MKRATYRGDLNAWICDRCGRNTDDCRCADISLADIPPAVLEALRERDHKDERIVNMSPKDMFLEYCIWEGLLGGHGETLWDIVGRLLELEGGGR